MEMEGIELGVLRSIDFGVQVPLMPLARVSSWVYDLEKPKMLEHLR
jgi:hypothetical protein